MRSLSQRTPISILLFALLIAVALTAVALSPAAGTGPEGITTFSGSTAGAVAYSSNSSTGTAVEGVTGAVAGGKALWGVANNALNAGTGVRATAYGPSSFGLYAEAINTSKAKPSYGLFATSKSSYAVYAFTNVPGLTSLLAYNSDATSNGSHAIRAQSRGDAIISVSTGNNGIVGQTSATPTPAPSAVIAKAGVLGQETTSSFYNAGVAGTSTNGFGVFGKSGASSGVQGITTTAYGAGVFGWADRFAGGGSPNLAYPTGVFGFSDSHNGVAAVSANSGTGADSAGLLAQNLGSGVIIIAAGAGADVMSLDNSGNMILSGNLTVDGTISDNGGGSVGNCSTCPGPLTVHRIAPGTGIGTYSTQQTTPSIDDVGQAQLVNGQAYVRLDPGFARLIDRANYLVFITPRGDNRGLYVAQTSPSGFVVRESRSGRSTLFFDYRVIAKPAGSSARRLPLIDTRKTDAMRAQMANDRPALRTVIRKP